MSSNSSKIRLKEDGSVASCADPNRPFQPIWPNKCGVCKRHSDMTCHDFLTK
jgi:hypothetical protein